MSKVLMQTSLGDITIELNHDKAPVTATNFARYVGEDFYNGVIFHRIIDGFMIQGGGFDASMNQKETHACIENEADNGLTNTVGSVAMARTTDPHSASAQFFINVNNNSFLNHTSKSSQGWGYTVFAMVVDGMDVVNQIKAVATTTKAGHQDVPVDPVVIQTATMLAES
jgi:peptidyl-prolyl cis-trans isomerase B (cyclophilin B)